MSHHPLVVDVDTKRVTHHDAVTLVRRDQVVARVDATYDLQGVPDEHFWSTVNLIRSGHRGIRIALMSVEDRRRGAEYIEAMEQWRAIPWWRRIFTRRPRY
jgi:hypothetical protein